VQGISLLRPANHPKYTGGSRLSPAEVADLLRVPVGTVYYWRKTKRGPKGTQVGRHVLYNRAGVVAWWDQRLARDETAS